MTVPTLSEAEVYKSPVIQSQVRVAVQLDYPVFSGTFHNHFKDSDYWFEFCPSWGIVDGDDDFIEIRVPGNPDYPDNGISSPWIQSRHGLAFPLRRDTNWSCVIDCRFPQPTGFGQFIAICGNSFRDVQAICAIKSDLAGGAPGNTDGLRLHFPYDGYYSPNNTIVWSTNSSTGDGHKYLIEYDAATQLYTWSVDISPIDGTYEFTGTVPVNGRYADAIVVGNSVAIQGVLGTWTKIDLAEVTVTGTAETVEVPSWASGKTFALDGHTFAYLPTVIDGHVTVDKDNAVDAAELTLDQFSLDDVSPRTRTYTHTNFLHKRALIEARAGDGYRWLPWQTIFNGECGEKQTSLDKQGKCTVTLPMRDRYRAILDDKEIMAAYADTGADVIPDVGHNLTVAEIIYDLIGKAGITALFPTFSLQLTPWNIPRNYNVYRTSALQSVKSIADQTALATYQYDIANAYVAIQDWYWGTDVPTYHMSTEQEIEFLEWTESAFDAVSNIELAFESTEYGHTQYWPPHREPFYGKIEHTNSISCQDSEAHDHRPIDRLLWWIHNRKVGSVRLTTKAQLWVLHDAEIGINDDRFLGLSRNESWIVDGWEHSWSGQDAIQTTIRLINTHPERFIRRALVGA